MRLEKKGAARCNLIKRRGELRGENSGREIGEKLGQERGEKTGRKVLSVLLQKLIQEGRKEEANRILQNDEYQEQLLREYHLE